MKLKLYAGIQALLVLTGHMYSALSDVFVCLFIFCHPQLMDQGGVLISSFPWGRRGQRQAGGWPGCGYALIGFGGSCWKK